MPEPGDPLILFYALIVGLLFGSFVTALSFRVPRGEDFVAARSRCPACGHTLGFADLFPVLSWVLSRGHCRHCRVPISWRYPVIEGVTALAFIFLATRIGDWLVLLAAAAFTVVLLALAVIDIEKSRLPNGLVVAAGVLALILWGLSPRSLADLGLVTGGVAIAAVALRLLGYGLARGPGLGWGDIKLAVAVAPVIPPESWIRFLVVLALIGGVSALYNLLVHKLDRFPFGPAVAAAAFASLL